VISDEIFDLFIYPIFLAEIGRLIDYRLVYDPEWLHIFASGEWPTSFN